MNKKLLVGTILCGLFTLNANLNTINASNINNTLNKKLIEFGFINKGTHENNKNTAMYKYLKNHSNENVIDLEVTDLNNESSFKYQHIYLVGKDDALNDAKDQLKNFNRLHGNFVINGITFFSGESSNTYNSKPCMPYKEIDNLGKTNFMYFNAKDNFSIKYNQLSNKEMIDKLSKSEDF